MKRIIYFKAAHQIYFFLACSLHILTANPLISTNNKSSNIEGNRGEIHAPIPQYKRTEENISEINRTHIVATGVASDFPNIQHGENNLQEHEWNERNCSCDKDQNEKYVYAVLAQRNPSNALWAIGCVAFLCVIMGAAVRWTRLWETRYSWYSEEGEPRILDHPSDPMKPKLVNVTHLVRQHLAAIKQWKRKRKLGSKSPVQYSKLPVQVPDSEESDIS